MRLNGEVPVGLLPFRDRVEVLIEPQQKAVSGRIARRSPNEDTVPVLEQRVGRF